MKIYQMSVGYRYPYLHVNNAQQIRHEDIVQKYPMICAEIQSE